MICKICNKEMKCITNTHLKFHNIKLSEYIEMFPEVKKIFSNRLSKIAKGKIDVKNGKSYDEVFGKEKSDSIKNKISKKLEGRTSYVRTKDHRDSMSKLNKGQVPWNKGKKYPEYSGKNNPNYNPNLSDEERQIRRSYPEYREWRTAVYERDEFTCQCCSDNTGGNLNSHHIESYSNNPELRTTIENGITLCETCHKDFHHNFGYGNNTKKQLYVFLLEHKKEKQNG